jgi:hypothetical protein
LVIVSCMVESSKGVQECWEIDWFLRASDLVGSQLQRNVGLVDIETFDEADEI